MGRLAAAGTSDNPLGCSSVCTKHQSTVCFPVPARLNCPSLTSFKTAPRPDGHRVRSHVTRPGFSSQKSSWNFKKVDGHAGIVARGKNSQAAAVRHRVCLPSKAAERFKADAQSLRRHARTSRSCGVSSEGLNHAWNHRVQMMCQAKKREVCVCVGGLCYE